MIIQMEKNFHLKFIKEGYPRFFQENNANNMHFFQNQANVTISVVSFSYYSNGKHYPHHHHHHHPIRIKIYIHRFQTYSNKVTPGQRTKIKKKIHSINQCHFRGEEWLRARINEVNQTNKNSFSKKKKRQKIVKLKSKINAKSLKI